MKNFKINNLSECVEIKIDCRRIKNWEEFKDKPILIKLGDAAKLFITFPHPFLIYREISKIKAQGEFYIRIFGDGQIYIFCNHDEKMPEFRKFFKIERAPFEIKMYIPKEKKEAVINHKIIK